jgi:hypothetical protein
MRMRIYLFVTCILTFYEYFEAFVQVVTYKNSK